MGGSKTAPNEKNGGNKKGDEIRWGPAEWGAAVYLEVENRH